MKPRKLRSISYGELPDSAEGTVFDLWEAGKIQPSLSTPSVWSREYRTLVTSLLLRYSKSKRFSISLGCGNAFVEGQVRTRGLRIFGMDRELRAAILAKRRVEGTLMGDAEALPLRERSVGCVYADGLLGHLWRSDAGLRLILLEIRRVLESGGIALLSNDLADDSAPSLRVSADKSAQFFRGPRGYTRKEAALVGGFQILEEQVWHYERPGRGPRIRELIVLSKEQ